MESKRLELSGNRLIAIRDRGNVYTFMLSQISQRDWQKYFDGIESTSERRGKETLNTFDATTPILSLIERQLVGAEGYALPEGVEALSQMDNWQQKIPLRHRLAIAEVLTAVNPVIEDDTPIAAGFESVRIEALWNADDRGRMQSHRDLVHRFRSPEFEHQRRYMRDQSRSVVVGGARNGKTLWQGVQRTLMEIYDELIDGVEGYSFEGFPLQDIGIIVDRMDAYHKVVAAQQLFRCERQEED
jgi:hypothetical protein